MPAKRFKVRIKGKVLSKRVRKIAERILEKAFDKRLPSLRFERGPDGQLHFKNPYVP